MCLLYSKLSFVIEVRPNYAIHLLLLGGKIFFFIIIFLNIQLFSDLLSRLQLGDGLLLVRFCHLVAKNKEFKAKNVYLKALCCSLGLPTLVMASPVMPVDKNKTELENITETITTWMLTESTFNSYKSIKKNKNKQTRTKQRTL